MWKCDSDHGGSNVPNQDAPCIHMVLVFVRLDHIQMPDTSAGVERKGRDRSAERRAWRRMAQAFPQVLEDLVRVGVPAILAKPDASKAGRPRRWEAAVYQAVYRVWHRMNMEASTGLSNPWGACAASTLGLFHADPEALRVLKMLGAISLWPVRELERIIYPDGTGLSPQHFHAYYDERYRGKKPKTKKKSKIQKAREARLANVPANAVLSARDRRLRARQVEREAKRLAAGKEKPRLHTWAYAEFLWAYQSGLIAAWHFQSTPFHEAPKFLALLEQARFMLDLKAFGGDRAYDANYIFQYAAKNDLEAHIPTRDTGIPTDSSEKKKYRKAAMIAELMDPDGAAARHGRRNAAENGNAAFKARLGDEVFCRGRRNSKDRTSLEVEVACMVIGWNITRLVMARERYGEKVKLDFTGGADRIKAKPWRSAAELEPELRRKYPPKGDGGVRPEWQT
ncbi:MAG: hypothetical protein QOD77_226 [Thermoplasmata archaeon]|nr:hypothetical protein [Thermoplasmata archaeon]